jgi:fatty-acyl-CoA synthase
MADLVLVNINPAYRAEELEFTINNVEIRALITAEHFRSSDYDKIIHSIVPELDTCAVGNLLAAKVPSLKYLIMISDNEHKGYLNFDEVYTKSAASEFKERTTKVNYLDPTNIQFTSGTTGLPKGATLSHFNIVNNAYFLSQKVRYTPDDRLLL